MRILVVDDHHDTVSSLARLLKMSGHSPATAEGFHAAINLSKAERFDLLLSDIGLRDGDGCDLLAEVSTMYAIKGVALTGFGLPEDLARFKQAGFWGVLLKPVDFGKLREAIEAVAAGQQDTLSPESKHTLFSA